MTESTPVTPGALRALAARYRFQQERMEKSATDGNEKVMKMAMSAMAKVEQEALMLGTTIEQLLAIEAPVTAGATAPQKLPAANPPVRAGSVGVTPKPKSVVEAERVAERARAIAAEKAAGGQIPGSTRKAPRPKKGEAKMRPCLDGCGTMVPGNFKMGHDAKLKSLILKVERGEEAQTSVPEIAQGLVSFRRGEKVENRDAKGKVISSVQEMQCTAAPVRFPGRPEIKLTVRED
jgi:hypothetical protein